MIIQEFFWYKNKGFTRLKLDRWEDPDLGWFEWGDKDDTTKPPDTPTAPPDPGIPSDWAGGITSNPPPTPEFNASSSGKVQDFIKKADDYKNMLSDSIEKIKDTLDDLNPAKKFTDWLRQKEKEGQSVVDLVDDEVRNGRARDFDEAIQNLKDQGKIQERDRSEVGKVAQQVFDKVVEGVSFIGETLLDAAGFNDFGKDISGQARDATRRSGVLRDLGFNYEVLDDPTTSSGKEAQENRYREEIERNKAQAAAQGKPAAEQNVQKKAEQVLVESEQPKSWQQKFIEDLGKLSSSFEGEPMPTIPDTPPSDIFPSWAWPSSPDGSGSITLDRNKSGNFSDIAWVDQMWEEHTGNSYMTKRYYIYDEWYYPKGYKDDVTVFMAIEVRKQNEEEN